MGVSTKKKLTQNDILKYIKNNTEKITKTVVVNGNNCLYEEKVLDVENFIEWLKNYE